jgi:aspartyl/asparaginyl beta-hydroxylase (cupin superfamily)
MTSQTTQLVQAAVQAANSGRMQEAERLWQEVRRMDPQHPKALFSLGFHALQRGDLGGALEYLRAARSVAPNDVVTLMTLAAAFKAHGDTVEEREAIEAALAVDAYFLPGILAKASWFERSGQRTAASKMYQGALNVAGPDSQWPQQLKGHLQHARAFVDRYGTDYHEFLAQAVADRQAALPPKLAGRWREAISIMAGRSKPYHQDCNQLTVPRIPAIPFPDRELFPELEVVERKTDVIRDELLAALQADRDKFTPYIGYGPGEPVNQWQELNHSLRWSVLKLWAGGEPVQENIERCPETAKALDAVPRVDIGGLCPNAMFSALAPRTTIPPHHGETNARLVAHLPLIVPERCVMRVGFERREWKVGQVLILDDTIEHEAINDSDELRVVLIFDVWNPLLAPEEREMVRAITAAARAYSG